MGCSATIQTAWWQCEVMDMALQIVDVSKKGLLDLLIQDYLGELSAYNDDIQSVDGRFQYSYLDAYWQDTARDPYFIFSENQLAGFLLIRQDHDPRNGRSLMEVAELYITKDHRRRSIGGQALKKIWQHHSGYWRVCVLASNKPAYCFWQSLIHAADSDYSETTPSAATNHQFVFLFNTGDQGTSD